MSINIFLLGVIMNNAIITVLRLYIYRNKEALKTIKEIEK